MTTRSAYALAAALLCSAPLAAQTSVIDEGSFRLEVNGSGIGIETFTIRRSGAGANATIIAQSRVVLDTGQRTRTLIQFRATDLRPTVYQIRVEGGDGQEITGRATGNRFRATTVSPQGERMREYLTDPDAVIITDEVAHQHYFFARVVDDSGSVPVILPRQNRQVTAYVADQGPESVQIGDQQLSARRLAVDITGLDPRIVWVDRRHRVLRLAIPAQDFLAVRTSAP